MSYEEPCATSSSARDDWDEEMHSEESSQQDIFSLSSSESNYGRGSRVSVLSAATEMLRIRFPFLSISVKLADFLCLQEKELLNDTIVDFFLNHIAQHLLPEAPNKRVNVLPAVFWHNLSIRHSCLPEDFTTLSAGQQDEARFADLLEFLDDFELFESDFLLIPVNEWEHWSLIVVCHPFTENGTILCFDSLLNDDNNNLAVASKVVEEFLGYAWAKRSGKATKLPAMKTVVPHNLPQQSAPADDGLYVLEYAKRFLLDTPTQIDNFDFSACYPNFSIRGKRQEIQKTILSSTANRQMWTPLMELLERNNRQQHQQQAQHRR